CGGLVAFRCRDVDRAGGVGAEGHGGHGDGRADGVDADVVAAHFEGEGFGEAGDGAFGTAVDADAFFAGLGGFGGDENDGAAVLADHDGGNGVNAVEDAADVDGDLFVPGFGPGIEEEFVADDPGAGDEDIDGAPACGGA